MGYIYSFAFFLKLNKPCEKLGFENNNVEIRDALILKYRYKGLNNVYIDYWLNICVRTSYFSNTNTLKKNFQPKDILFPVSFLKDKKELCVENSMEYLDETKDMHTCSDRFISHKTCNKVTTCSPFRWLKRVS